ncbi:MAG: peptidoglycan bridge formation glycyltransferase FemA/FemB family protein [Patescibacteria group bacterium]
MKIKEIDNKIIWEDFLKGVKDKTFLQSWNWGEFQKGIGEKIWRMGIYEEKSKLIGVALVIKVTAKRGCFLFVPHGPILSNSIEQIANSKKEMLKIVIKELKSIARREKIIFIRIAPFWERKEENIKIFRRLGFRDAPIHIHPELTWQLDITKSEDEILKNMRKTTRNLVKRAEKEGVEIFSSKDFKDIELFYRSYQETVRRHVFVPFARSFLEKEMRNFLPESVLLFFASWKGDILSCAMIIFWQGVAFYHHGASSSKFPKIPASYLLQWRAIKEAKKRGCQLYNFWGIAPEEDLTHPWHGLTLFKKGFGGEKREYVRTQDLPLSFLYFKNWIIEIIRRKKRRL